MKCPICEEMESYIVYEVRAQDGTVGRKRTCHFCGHKWYTQEKRVDKLEVIEFQR